MEGLKKIQTRKELLLKVLGEQKEMSIGQVADTLNISIPSARRLCTKMAIEDRIIRTHGGIRIMPIVHMPYSFDDVRNEEIQEKTRIAQYACQLVHSGQTIFLEAGTTVLQVAIALAQRIEKKELTNLIIYTNSLSNLEVLEPVCTVNVIGGEYRPARRDFSGYISERVIRSLRFDMCFVGADAVDLDDGIMAQDVSTVQFDELLIHRSAQSVVLAQSVKFLRHSLISYADLSDISVIVTDDNLPEEIAKQCRARNGNLVLVPMA